MKMAKASEDDLIMAMDLCNALDAFEQGYFTVNSQRHEDESFDTDSGEDCKRAIEEILHIYGKASLMRVVFGMATLLNPANKLVDPDADTLEHHPNTVNISNERDELLNALKSLNYTASNDYPNAKIVAAILAKPEYQS